MDNIQQIAAIKEYRDYLSALTHIELDMDTVAAIWIRKYAEIWRELHQFPEK